MLVVDATPLSLRLDTPRPDMGPLLAAIARLVDARGAAVLHVTAARAGEGTTTVARELAAAAARAPWCRTALVDAHAGAGPSGHPCLADALGRGQALALHPGHLHGAPVDMARLLQVMQALPAIGQLRTVMAALRARYTLVVIDAPPVLDAQSFTVLAAVSDGVVLVAEAERTPLSDIRSARAALEQMGGTVLGVVLNKRRRRLPGLLQRLTQ